MYSKNVFFPNRVVISLLLLKSCSVSPSMADSANLDTLQFVQVLFRHGDRTPEYAYPTDPYQEESNWPEGWGQLTEKGKMQEYELGTYLRNRYGTFISDKYTADEIYVLSSDMDRTIMSAELCLAGLFPTNKNETTWNPDINWQPVPLHTIATENDNLLRMKRNCSRFEELFNDFLNNSEVMKKLNSENAELFKYLSDKSGVNVQSIVDIKYFYGPLVVEQLNNLTLPEWATPLFTDDHFQYLHNLSFTARTYTPDLQRLRTGQLVKYLSNNINKSISNTLGEAKTKFVLIAGHDVTIADLMNTFGVYNMKCPGYGTALLMEIHRDINSTNTSKFYFNILLRNETTNEAYKLSLPGCDFNCPLETFFEKISPIIPENWDKECQSLFESEQFSWITISAIGVLITIIGGVLVSSSLTLYKRIRQNKKMRKEYQLY